MNKRDVFDKTMLSHNRRIHREVDHNGLCLITTEDVVLFGRSADFDSNSASNYVRERFSQPPLDGFTRDSETITTFSGINKIVRTVVDCEKSPI